MGDEGRAMVAAGGSSITTAGVRAGVAHLEERHGACTLAYARLGLQHHGKHARQDEREREAREQPGSQACRHVSRVTPRRCSCAHTFHSW